MEQRWSVGALEPLFLVGGLSWSQGRTEFRIPGARNSGNSGFIGNRDLIRELRQEITRYKLGREVGGNSIFVPTVQVVSTSR